MCIFRRPKTISAPPVPTIVPMAQNVSREGVNEAETLMADLFNRERRRRGVASTIRNEGGAAGVGAGRKTLLGQ